MMLVVRRSVASGRNFKLLFQALNLSDSVTYSGGQASQGQVNLISYIKTFYHISLLYE